MATLNTYDTNEIIREATEAERAASAKAAQIDGGAGVITIDGERCFVQEEESPTAQYCAYTVIDRDASKRFSTTDFQQYASAEREVSRLNLTYGKQFCLGVAGIDVHGNLHEIDDEK